MILIEVPLTPLALAEIIESPTEPVVLIGNVAYDEPIGITESSII